MRSNKKQITTYFILCSLLLIGVVYALLQANLQINGTAKIQANTWDIHFDNIQVNENSVSIGTGDSPATIDPNNNCKVDFEVTLSIPGDFYEFTIDVVNAGTIDGMIGVLNKTLTVDGVVVEEVPNYLDYIVTYSDGVEIEENHKINAGVTETYKVRLEFKTDIEELPSATTISTSLTPQYIQADSTAIVRPGLLYDVFKTEANNGNGLVHEYTGEHKDSFTVTGTEKIYHWYADSDDNANIILDKWNVIFGGFCWQAFRTTDTGGVKLIYSKAPTDGKCIVNQYATNINSKFNNNYNSPAYVGYMYNPNTVLHSICSAADEGSIFGSDVTYDEENGLYTLNETNNALNNYHHYTCNDDNGICPTVRYYSYTNCYVELNGGKKITQALNDMLNADDVNQENSTIKDTTETWYQNNMTAYTNSLEDFIFCNSRIISDYGGWNPNGGWSGSNLNFGTGYSLGYLGCQKVTDQFCRSNSKAPLEYPVGLMTYDEANLLNNQLLRNGDKSWYWLGNYGLFDSSRASGRAMDKGQNDLSRVYETHAVRPVISLKPGTIYTSGDGSKDNPYIIE